jgi:hypothetical protein
MWGRLVLVFLLAMLLPGLAEAADCIVARDGGLSVVDGEACAGLKVMSRRRDDPRPNIDVIATWVEFTEPRNAGEWRYNEWARQQVKGLNFDRPLNPLADRRSEDRLGIASFYRSPRLISARYARWLCCDLKISTIYASINIDIAGWSLFSPDDAVSLGAAANRCWQRFADHPEHGRAFGEAYPRARAWRDDDFEHRQIGRVMHTMIGPVVVEPKVSEDRTQRLFVEVLKNQSRWSFSEQGAAIDFGELLGFASGPFFCELPNSDLKQIARPGAAIPP